MIKKLLMSLLTLMLIFALTACGNGDQNSEESDPAPNDNGNNITDSSSMVENLINYLGDEYFMEMKMSLDLYETGEPQEITVYTATKGNMLYSQTGDAVTMLYRDNMAYVLDPSTLTYSESYISDEELNSINSFNLENMTFNVAIGSEEIEGKAYDYEDVIINGITERYYFDGSKLVYLKTEGDLVEILNYGTSVDASFFEIPSDYTLTEVSDYL